jgi:hypothetical protein
MRVGPPQGPPQGPSQGLPGTPTLLLVDRLYRSKSMAFELPATLWTVRQRFGVSLARFEVVEEHPLVLPSSPPQLPPQLVTPFAWTM